MPAPLPERIHAIVIYGGQSAEHDVSRVSAATVSAALDPDRYEVTQIAITGDGEWLLADGSTDDAALGGLSVTGTPLHALDYLQAESARTDTVSVVIPVLHGPNGEDGTIQGLFELAGISYVGSGVLGSAIAADKSMAKTLTAAAGINQAAFRYARSDEVSTPLLNTISAELGFPMFVKPSNMGSSVGVSKVSERSELDGAVAEALRYDGVVIFEEEIIGRELEIGVLGNSAPRVSIPGEILAGASFYDFDDKYRNGVAQTVIPADLTSDEQSAMAELALDAYRALRCGGLARVDMFLRSDGGGFVLNEINTFPGFTSISMFPKMWEASGLPMAALIDEMVGYALS